MTTTPAAVVACYQEGEGRGRIDSAGSVPPEDIATVGVGRQDGLVVVGGEIHAAPPKAKEAAAALAPDPVSSCHGPPPPNYMIAEGFGGQGGRIHTIYTPGGHSNK